MRPYVIVSLLTGARTEELRALIGRMLISIPIHLRCHCGTRFGEGDTKTRRSRRTLQLPGLCVEILRAHRVARLQARVAAGTGGPG